jgi:malate dehydrogenase
VHGAFNGGGIPHIAYQTGDLACDPSTGQTPLRARDTVSRRPGYRHALVSSEKRFRDRETNSTSPTRHQAHAIHADRIVPVATAVIIGAGDLGGALARQLAAADVVSTITLLDDDAGVAQGKALDIRQAAPIDCYSTAVGGTAAFEAVIGATFVVLADKAEPPGGEWQDDAAVNLVGRLAALNQTAPILCAGSHQALVIERSVRELGVAAHRIFGTAPDALRSAIVALTALEAGCAATDVSLAVVGRPPHQIIVPWEDASIAGRRATSVLSPPAITRLDGRLSRLWPPGPLTLASAAARAIASALAGRPRTISVFVSVTRGAGGLGRAGMLPVVLSPRGIDAVMTPTLSVRDQVRLETAIQ